MDFNEIAQVQPELYDIKREAENWYGHYDRWTHYEKLKAKVKKCVGWKAKKGLPEFMYTREAYDVAVREIFR